MMDYEKVAKTSIEELSRVGVPVPDDDYEAMVEYVKDGEMALINASSFDPSVHARQLAEDAAREYAKARYAGTPVHNSSFPYAAQVWMRGAAKEFHRAN